MIQGHWEQTIDTPGSSGTVFTYSKSRERVHKILRLAMCQSFHDQWIHFAVNMSNAASHTPLYDAMEELQVLPYRDWNTES